MAGTNHLATMNDDTQVYVNWDGDTLAWYEAKHGLMVDAVQADDHNHDGLLPPCPEALADTQMNGAMALLPLESMLVRNLHLPLHSVNLLDADMLQQELADRVGVDPNTWWLCWDFSASDDGIRGLVFGIPEALRQQMADTDHWQHLTHLGVDGWHRLQSCANDDGAILEQDSDGIFLAVFLAGCWHGMRRINGVIDADMWLQITASLQAMGFEPNTHALNGNIDTTTLAYIQAVDWSWQGEVLEESIPRYHANLRALMDNESQSHHAPNFRRGRWAAQGSWQSFRPWLRSGVLAAGVLMLLFIAQLIDISRLEQQQDDAESRIITAFHQGLPDETVMLDPLAQLRKAATQQGKTAATSYLLTDLQGISRSYQQQPWQMKSLNLQRGKMQLAGKTDDVKSLNQLQATLAKEIAHTVRIVDTNLGKQIAFRLEWTWQ